MTDKKIPNDMNYRQNQVFGSDELFQNVQHEDIINSIQFDPTGELLAIGDNAGRIILFKEQDDQFGQKKSFQYHSEFQSHLPEFDSLKSLTMTQSIQDIKWLRPQGKYKKMLTSSCNRIKLWKMFQKTQNKVILTADREGHFKEGHQFAMPLLNKQSVFTANPQAVFPIKHNGSINKVQVSNNQQYALSTDQEKGIMWNFQKYAAPFIVQDIDSKKHWKEGEKISCSKLHPQSDSIFMCGTTKGTIQLNDLRISFSNRKNTSFLTEKLHQQHNNYFNQMTSKISSLQFLGSGKYIVSRDYLSVKIWDICRPSQPVNVIRTNESKKQKICHLFQNDCIEDAFQTSTFSDNLVVTGTYDNRFNIIDPVNNHNVEYMMRFDDNAKISYLNVQKSTFAANYNLNRKILACGVHRQSQKIALASLNSFFIYSPQNDQSSCISL